MWVTIFIGITVITMLILMLAYIYVQMEETLIEDYVPKSVVDHIKYSYERVIIYLCQVYLSIESFGVSKLFYHFSFIENLDYCIISVSSNIEAQIISTHFNINNSLY